jgi:hypothetical protein
MTIVWHWIAANGISLLIALYLANIACTMLLALCLRWLSRLVGQLRGEVGRQRHLTSKLERDSDALALQLSAQAEKPSIIESPDTGGRRSALASIREEIVSLQSEFAAGWPGPNKAPGLDSATPDSSDPEPEDPPTGSIHGSLPP